MRLPFIWLLILILSVFFAGFLRGQQHERKRWDESLGACDLPQSPSEAVLIFQGPAGNLVCQRRQR